MNQIIFSVILALTTFASVSNAAYCSGAPEPGERTNEFPIYDQPLKFIKSVKNGMLFEAGPPNATFPVVHVWGNAYEVGYAQGELVGRQVREFVYKTWGYLESEALQALHGPVLPTWLKALIISKGMRRALEWTRSVTEAFTPQEYFDEIQGIADATGMDYDLLYELNMFAELTKAQCSFFGAWDTAVANTGYSYQLRALDFDTEGPFKDFPQVTVYHPTDGNAWAQVGWPGSIGVLTGFSEKQMAISEIGVYFSDDSFGQGNPPDTPPEKVKGEPWMFVLRDTLKYTSSLEEGINRIATSNRTCNLIIGLGDGKEAMVNGIEYSGYVCVPYADDNLLPQNDTWHGQITDVVYNGMDWNCPGYNQVLHDQLSKYHGQIDEYTTVKNILPTTQTGNLHAAVYDLYNWNMHVSFARKESADPSEPQYAYERQFTRLHMKDIFATAKPEV